MGLFMKCHLKYILQSLCMFILLAQTSTIEAREQHSKGSKKGVSQQATSPYVKNPGVSDEAWEAVQPYLLPLDHPIKAKLDVIFSDSLILSNIESMHKAGFSCKNRGKRLTVGKHSKLKGYLVKTYLHTHEFTGEWKTWIRRIKGALNIQECIEGHQYTDLRKTPKKWIYPISNPFIDTPYPKYFVLVVEDMHVYRYFKNTAKYYHMMDKRRVEALYTVLGENALIDSCFIDNIPFCRDGRIAFIDTEYYNIYDKPMRWAQLNHKFSPSMQKYWMQLTHQID
jgi:hypothetical protein